MKKLISIAILFLPVTLYAGYKEDKVAEFQKLEAKKQEYQFEINKIVEAQIEIRGILKELESGNLNPVNKEDKNENM